MHWSPPTTSSHDAEENYNKNHTHTHAEYLWCKYAARQPASQPAEETASAADTYTAAPIYRAYHSVGYGVRRERRRM